MAQPVKDPALSPPQPGLILGPHPAGGQNEKKYTSTTTRTHARGRARTLALHSGSKATTPRSKEKAPVLSSRLLRSRAKTKMPLIGRKYKRPASTGQGLSDWLVQTRMLWQQVVFDRFPEPLAIVGIVVSIWRDGCWDFLAFIR